MIGVIAGYKDTRRGDREEPAERAASGARHCIRVAASLLDRIGQCVATRVFGVRCGELDRGNVGGSGRDRRIDRFSYIVDPPNLRTQRITRGEAFEFRLLVLRVLVHLREAIARGSYLLICESD